MVAHRPRDHRSHRRLTDCAIMKECRCFARRVKYWPKAPPATLHGVVFDIFGWEPTGLAFGEPDDRLRDEAIQPLASCFAEPVTGSARFFVIACDKREAFAQGSDLS